MVETRAYQFVLSEIEREDLPSGSFIVYVAWFNSGWQVCDCWLVSFVTSLNGLIDVLRWNSTDIFHIIVIMFILKVYK